MNNPYNKQGGIALITVLLVFAIITVIAGSMVERTFLAVHRAERQLVHAQAWQYALAGEALARQMLYTDFADAQPVEHEDRPKKPGILFKMVETFEQGELDVSVFDLQAGFNINNLVGGAEEDNERALKQFNRLMENLSVEPKAIETLLNWNDIHTAPAAIDTAGADYLSREHACCWSSTNWLITDLSELYSLKEIDRETIDKLLPYLVALPPPVAVNVNTAPAPVLQALTGGLGSDDAERIVDARGSRGFAELEDFNRYESSAGLEMKISDVTTKSRYFMAFVKSTFADETLSLLTVFYRHPETNRVRTLSRNRGGDFSFDTPGSADRKRV